MTEEIEFDAISKTKSSCIVIRNAYKRYTNQNVILNGLDMTVPAGGIYGLLGPSGCGKTTLLNCIVGQLQLDFGSVWLNVKKRSDIGFMPQTISLHESMTISENLFFYGYVFGMSSKDVQSRAADLIRLLDLPSGHRVVGDLSGGQRRRVSMAIAIIHDPKLIILDEPTAGLDPILSYSLWQNLKLLANSGKSIILTTHYIQEVTEANMVGIMRNGVLMIEDNPQSIVYSCHCRDLEEAFLILSQKQECEKKKTKYIDRLEPTQVIYEEDGKFFSLKKFKAIMYKNIKQVRREYTFQILISLIPVMSAIFFSIAIGRYPKNIRLAIVNDESNCDMYQRDGCFLDDNSNLHMSCIFLEALKNKTYESILYQNDAKAWNDLDNSHAWAMLHFKKNYTRSLALRVIEPQNMEIQNILDGFVETHLDSSNFVIGEVTVKHDLLVSMVKVLQQAMQKCNLDERIYPLPPLLITSVWKSNNNNFVSYVASTLFIINCFCSPALVASLQLFAEKTQGIMKRMRITGVSLKEIIFVVIIIQFVSMIIQNSMVLTIMFCVFDNPMRGSWLALFSLAVVTGISGVLYGVVLALVNDHFMFMSFFGINLSIVLCYTTGLFWPIEAASKTLKTFNWLVPLTATVDAAHGLTSRNLSIGNPIVFKGFIEGFAWNIVFLLLTYVIVIRQKRN